MTNFITRVISLLLIFIMLVISPLIYTYASAEMENRRLLLNEVSQFLDKVTDKGEITEDDLTEFYLQVSSHGMTLKPVVKRLVRTTVMTPAGVVKTAYIAADDVNSLNQRDVVQVTLNELSVSRYRRILNAFLKIDEGPYHLEMAAVVR